MNGMRIIKNGEELNVNAEQDQRARIGDIVVDGDDDMYIITGSVVDDFKYALVRITGAVDLFETSDDSINDLLDYLEDTFGISEIIPQEKISLQIS